MAMLNNQRVPKMAVQIHWTQLLAMFATEKPKLRAAQRKDPATMALVEKNLKKK